jgi:hypothetical protein
MVHISHETEEQIEARLKKVISESDFKIYEGTYVFEEFPLDEFSKKASSRALALVRDTEVWSQLVPSSNQSLELFTVFSFHFNNCSDNSGFVGWLASCLKRELGTGVFVTCGQNSDRGGIFDYWGCPTELGKQAITVVRKLIQEGRN